MICKLSDYFLSEYYSVSGDKLITTGYDMNHVAVYKFDEPSGTGVGDYFGVNNGVASNTTIIDGYSGKCRHSAGGNAQISFTGKVIPLGAKTIDFYVRRSGFPPVLDYFLSHVNDSSTQHGELIFINSDGKLYWRSCKASATNRFQLVSANSICNNEFHHIKLTWDGTTNANGAKMFVDDMVNPSAAGTANATETVAQTNNLSLFCLPGYVGSYPFIGDIDEMLISNIVRV